MAALDRLSSLSRAVNANSQLDGGFGAGCDKSIKSGEC